MVASLQTIKKETTPRMQATARVTQGFAVQLHATKTYQAFTVESHYELHDNMILRRWLTGQVHQAHLIDSSLNVRVLKAMALAGARYYL